MRTCDGDGHAFALVGVVTQLKGQCLTMHACLGMCLYFGYRRLGHSDDAAAETGQEPRGHRKPQTVAPAKQEREHCEEKNWFQSSISTDDAVLTAH